MLDIWRICLLLIATGYIFTDLIEAQDGYGPNDEQSLNNNIGSQNGNSNGGSNNGNGNTGTGSNGNFNGQDNQVVDLTGLSIAQLEEIRDRTPTTIGVGRTTAGFDVTTRGVFVTTNAATDFTTDGRQGPTTDGFSGDEGFTTPSFVNQQTTNDFIRTTNDDTFTPRRFFTQSPHVTADPRPWRNINVNGGIESHERWLQRAPQSVQDLVRGQYGDSGNSGNQGGNVATTPTNFGGQTQAGTTAGFPVFTTGFPVFTTGFPDFTTGFPDFTTGFPVTVDDVTVNVVVTAAPRINTTAKKINKKKSKNNNKNKNKKKNGKKNKSGKKNQGKNNQKRCKNAANRQACLRRKSNGNKKKNNTNLLGGLGNGIRAAVNRELSSNNNNKKKSNGNNRPGLNGVGNTGFGNGLNNRGSGVNGNFNGGNNNGNNNRGSGLNGNSNGRGNGY